MPSFDTPGSVSLQIKLPSGRVVVTTADEPKTTVEVVALGRRGQDAIEEIEITMDERSGRHVVRDRAEATGSAGARSRSRGAATSSAASPARREPISTSPAPRRTFASTGELGEVSARTASGDIRLQGVGGPLQVKTASGDVFVGVVAGEAAIATVSGDVGVERIEAALTARGPSPATSRSARSRRSSASRRRRATSTSRPCRAATSACRRSRATFASASHVERASGSTRHPSPATSSRSSDSGRQAAGRGRGRGRPAPRQDRERRRRRSSAPASAALAPSLRRGLPRRPRRRVPPCSRSTRLRPLSAEPELARQDVVELRRRRCPRSRAMATMRAMLCAACRSSNCHAG